MFTTLSGDWRTVALAAYVAALRPREGYLSESQFPLCIKDPADLQADRLWKVERGYQKT